MFEYKTNNLNFIYVELVINVYLALVNDELFIYLITSNLNLSASLCMCVCMLYSTLQGNDFNNLIYFE